mmetsp:Transcript_5289/g.9711  ORF Transcript_5289/g.9711 Transcript_5289/m.9711 type:complete len:136 (+) Transcript_5289:611-1018(+)
MRKSSQGRKQLHAFTRSSCAPPELYPLIEKLVSSNPSEAGRNLEMALQAVPSLLKGMPTPDVALSQMRRVQGFHDGIVPRRQAVCANRITASQGASITNLPEVMVVYCDETMSWASEEELSNEVDFDAIFAPNKL